MADDALMETAAKAVERLLEPLKTKLLHIERELEPVKQMAIELGRIGQELRDRDNQLADVKKTMGEQQKEIRDLQKEADQNKWISRLAVALLIAGGIAWFNKSSTPPPIYVNVAPVSGAPASNP